MVFQWHAICGRESAQRKRSTSLSYSVKVIQGLETVINEI